MNKHVVLLTSFACLLTLGVILHSNLDERLRFPTNTDQDIYLAAGENFAKRFIFLWRAPLYSAWLGMFYFLSGGDLQRCFFFEKLLSILLLSGLVACLAYRLFDIRTSMLLGVWVLNCKYFILEANNSHTLATSLFIVSLLCLLLSNQALRLPTALLALFLSTQVRSEMWIIFLAVILYLVGRSIKRWITMRKHVGQFSIAGQFHWLSCLAIGAFLSVLFFLRLGPAEPSRLDVALTQNFAANYVERNHLSERYPDPWRSYLAIWSEALPEAPNPAAALRHYPDEVLGHVLYNMKLSLKALPANVLSFDHPLIMLIIFTVYLGLIILGIPASDHSVKWKSIPEETKRLVTLWLTATCLLIFLTFIFRAAVRYYIPLIPVQLMFIAFIGRSLANK
jgi:hypothetical protein